MEEELRRQLEQTLVETENLKDIILDMQNDKLSWMQSETMIIVAIFALIFTILSVIAAVAIVVITNANRKLSENQSLVKEQLKESQEKIEKLEKVEERIQKREKEFDSKLLNSEERLDEIHNLLNSNDMRKKLKLMDDIKVKEMNNNYIISAHDEMLTLQHAVAVTNELFNSYKGDLLSEYDTKDLDELKKKYEELKSSMNMIEYLSLSQINKLAEDINNTRIYAEKFLLDLKLKLTNRNNT